MIAEKQTHPFDLTFGRQSAAGAQGLLINRAVFRRGCDCREISHRLRVSTFWRSRLIVVDREGFPAPSNPGEWETISTPGPALGPLPGSLVHCAILETLQPCKAFGLRQLWLIDRGQGVSWVFLCEWVAAEIPSSPTTSRLAAHAPARGVSCPHEKRSFAARLRGWQISLPPPTATHIS